MGGALALFDDFKWIIIREGHKLNLVSADASDGGKPDASLDPEEQEISKQMEALKVRLEHKRRAKIVRPRSRAALDEFVEAPGNAKWMRLHLLTSEGRWQEGQEETQRVRRRLAGRPVGQWGGGGVGNRDRYHPATRWVGSTSREG